MKTVALREFEKHTSKKVLINVLELGHPQAGMDLGEMRRRMKVIDKLQGAAGDSVELEDAEHSTLVNALAKFPFAYAHKDFVVIADDVESAK